MAAHSASVRSYRSIAVSSPLQGQADPANVEAPFLRPEPSEARLLQRRSQVCTPSPLVSSVLELRVLPQPYRIEPGLPRDQLLAAAALYRDGRASHLADTLPRDERALAYLADSFDPIFAMSALGEDGTLFGFVAVSGRGRRDGRQVEVRIGERASGLNFRFGTRLRSEVRSIRNAS